MSIYNFFSARCKDDAYCIGYRRYNKNAELMCFNSNKLPFKAIRPSFRYWYADPIINRIHNNEYLFCEMYDRISNRGGIGISYFKNGKLSRPKKILRDKEHLSFPIVFEWKDEYYMWPCIGTDTIKIFKMGKDEITWYLWYETKKQEAYVDAILEVYNNKLYMIATELSRIDSYKTKKIVYEIRNLDNPHNLEWHKVLDGDTYYNDERNAGKLLEFDKVKYRVCQGSTQEEGYGATINFRQIENNDSYNESRIKEVTKEDFVVNLENSILYDKQGIHTYALSKEHEMEIIDVKIKAFSMIYIVRYLYENIKIFLKR